MSKNPFSVLIIEDDPYASDLMMTLLARDYRTQVIAELSNRVSLEVFGSLSDLRGRKNSSRDEDGFFKEDFAKSIDVVILDTEVPWNIDLPFQVAKKISTWANPPRILFMATHPNIDAIENYMANSCFSGYVLKEEVLYGLASAVCLAAKGYCVITPGVRSLVEHKFARSKFPVETLMISSPGMADIRKECDEIEKQIIRLGLLFDLPQHDIHDEMGFSETKVAKTMSKGYLDLLIPDIVSNKISLEELFNNPYIDNNKIVNHYQAILKELPQHLERRRAVTKSPKFRGMSTLAFHLLTRLDIQKWC